MKVREIIELRAKCDKLYEIQGGQASMKDIDRVVNLIEKEEVRVNTLFRDKKVQESDSRMSVEQSLQILQTAIKN